MEKCPKCGSSKTVSMGAVPAGKDECRNFFCQECGRGFQMQTVKQAAAASQPKAVEKPREESPQIEDPEPE